MGGRGSGGLPGTGRKPNEELAEAVPVEVPEDLLASEQAVWMRLAPKALQRGTLTPETVERFRLLCRAVVMEQAMAAKIEVDGWTYLDVSVDGAGVQHEKVRAHPLCGPHRGMMQRVEAGMTAFRLAPTGRPIVTTKEKPKSALEKLQARRLRAV
jgi:hypothetical protein